MAECGEGKGLVTKEEADLLQQNKKKIKKGDEGFSGTQSRLQKYDDEAIKENVHSHESHACSYKETLLGGANEDDSMSASEDESEQNFDTQEEMEDTTDFSGFQILEAMNGERDCPVFVLSREEEARMSKPWKKTLIIKLLGRKIGFKAQEPRLYKLWAKDGILDIIDLVHDYYMVKFSAYTDYKFALTGGLWLLYDHYLIIHPWKVDFDPEEDEIKNVAVWIRLPSLPIHLYDKKFLTFLGNRVGKTVKVDATTMEQARGKYARVCVEVNLSKPLPAKYLVKGKTLPIEYESIHLICFNCGTYGHYTESYLDMVVPNDEYE